MSLLKCDDNNEKNSITLQYFGTKIKAMICTLCLNDIKENIEKKFYTHTEIIGKNSINTTKQTVEIVTKVSS